MTDLIHELTKLVAAASPGQWEWSVGDGSLPTLERCDGTGESVLGVFVCPSCLKSKLPCMAPTPADAAYIAKANPENIALVLDVVEAALRVQRARKALLRNNSVSVQMVMDDAWRDLESELAQVFGPERPTGLSIAQLGRIESGVELSQVIEDHCGQPPEPPVEEPPPTQRPVHLRDRHGISWCGIVWGGRINGNRARHGLPVSTRRPDEVTCKKCLRAVAAKHAKLT